MTHFVVPGSGWTWLSAVGDCCFTKVPQYERMVSPTNKVLLYCFNNTMMTRYYDHTVTYLLIFVILMVHFQPIFHSQHIFSLSRTSTTSNGALKNKLIHMYHHSFQLSKFLWKSPRNKCLTMNLPTFLYPWSYRLRTRFHQTNCSYLLSSVMHKLRKWNSLHPIDRYFDRQCKIHT